MTLSADRRGSPLGLGLRRALVSALTGTGLANICRPLTRGTAVVFMLHRLSDPARGRGGCDPETLRSLLALLRRKRYNLVHLRTVLRALRGDGSPLRRTVAFTIDDGYAEQASVAGPIFAEFDCPVTTFVTTGFLDGDLWFWWDQIEYAFTHTARREVAVEIDGARRQYSLGDRARARRAQGDFTTCCKHVSDAAKHAAIQQLAAAADVRLPDRPPPEYAPMTWDDLRAAERQGMTFAPHSVTHPILARTDDTQSTAEIRDSWNRLRAEARDAVPVFAYPNGQLSDYGPREIAAVRAAGMEGAVNGVHAYATGRRFRLPDGAYQIPRFTFPDDRAYLAQIVTGLERFKLLLRGLD